MNSHKILGQYLIVQYDHFKWVSSKNGTQNGSFGKGSNLTDFLLGV